MLNLVFFNVFFTIGKYLQERNTESKYFEKDNLAVQYKLDNELELVYAAIFQKVIKLNYLDTFLGELQQEFKTKFADILTSERRLPTKYDFIEEFRNTLTAVEKSSSKASSAPKQMRSYNESTKSKKSVASMYDNNKNENVKKVVIQETSKQKNTNLTTENLILENRKRLKEKMTSKKNPTEPRSKATASEKAGKKPRVWDLGGSSKDAVILDRSKDQPQDGQYQKVQNNVSSIFFSFTTNSSITNPKIYEISKINPQQQKITLYIFNKNRLCHTLRKMVHSLSTKIIVQ